jgi:phosphatidylglycerol:prolipoprotein diacylglycerol transferase
MMPPVPWTYSLLMLAAIVTCGALLRRKQRILPLTTREKMGIGIGAFCGAMIGAKLPFVIWNWEELRSGAAWFSHGKTIMAGIVGGYLGVEFTKWALEIRVKTGDTFAAPVAIAVSIGRLACFVGGCCYGTVTTMPWGVCFPTSGDSVPRHPTQIYEAIFHAVAAGLLIWLEMRGLFRGQLMKLYILSYLVYRFFSEWLRPEASLALSLTAYQWASVLLFPVFAALWWRDAKFFARNERTFVIKA